MTQEFHNPYHFVPVNLPKTDDWMLTQDFKDRNLGHADHSRFLNGTEIFHGRLICKLTTKTPIFIGAQRYKEASDDAPAEVAPFELNGRPAIPATSLRGMISSIAEAASGSALRVLEDRVLSFRKPIEESLSAIGVIVRSAGKLVLRPLTLPTLHCGDNGDFEPELPQEYKDKYDYSCGVPLRILVGNYKEGSRTITLDEVEMRFEDLSRCANLHREFFYADIFTPTWEDIESERNNFKQNGNRGYSHHYKFVHIKKEHKDLLLYQRSNGVQFYTKDFLTKNPEKNERPYVRGVFRIMDGPARKFPHTVKHEMFIPYPQRADWSAFDRPIPEDVIKWFEQLADERTDVDGELPYQPMNVARRNSDADTFKNKLRLKDGDLVFFRLDSTGEVCEISYSANWRDSPQVEVAVGGETGAQSALAAGQGEPHVPKALATVHRFFERLDDKIDKEILPFHARREWISPAELLFGFVEERRKEEKTETPALAYASRVRFSNALLAPDNNNHDPYLPEVPLKILDSPKPPSPSLYFRNKQQGEIGYIANGDLNPADHQPQGRKFYLHHRDYQSEPWCTKMTTEKDARWKQKVKITPLRRKLTFYFHVDFNNLSRYELGMLCYALQPGETFQHKIGMGKPIGLGSIRIEPVVLYTIDRDVRYRSANPFEDPRYHTARLLNKIDSLDKLPKQYQYKPSNVRTEKEFLEGIIGEFKKSIDGAVEQAIQLLGDPSKVTAPVHTPLRKNQYRSNNFEKETFRWFVENVKTMAQSLKPLDANTTTLPTLKWN